MTKNNILKFSILSASLLVGSAAAINANIPAMAEVFQDIPLSMIEMLTTIPSLFLMVSVLTSSFIAKKFGYKQTIVTGLSIVAISGIIPLFINNFYIILISRACLGFGVGLFNSLLVSLINYFYEDKERASLYGMQTAFEGLGGITITFVAGQLLKINWQAPFLAYLIGFPALFLFFKFVPKVNTEDVLLKNGGTQVNQIEKKTGSFSPVFIYVAFLFIAAILYMTMGIKVSTLMTSEGYGTASDASLVIMLLSIGAITAGTLFGKVLKIFKNYTAVVGLLILALAMFIIGVSHSILLTVVGGFLSGFGFKLFQPYLIDRVNNSNIPNTSLATSLLLVGFNLGAFLSPYGSMILQAIAGDSGLKGLFMVNGLGFVILALGMLCFSLMSKIKKTA